MAHPPLLDELRPRGIIDAPRGRNQGVEPGVRGPDHRVRRGRLPLIGDQKIVLGSARKIEDKLHRLKIFYQQGMPYAGWNLYETINLKYNGQVVCRK